MKKPREYNGHVFEDNGHGDLFNAEVDKFLIFRPYPLLVDTVIHKDGSVTMNQEKFKENTDQKNGNYNEGYEVNDDGSPVLCVYHCTPHLYPNPREGSHTAQ